MKKLLPIILLLPSLSWGACDCGSVDDEAPCEGQAISVTIKSTTYNWAFNSGGGDATCGQFINGDYWVAPADGESDVTFTGLTQSGGLSIAMDANPVMESNGAFIYSVSDNWAGPDGNGEYSRSFRKTTSKPDAMWADGVLLTSGTVGSLTSTQWGSDGVTVYLGFDPSAVDVRYAPWGFYDIAEEEIHQFPQTYSGITSLVASIKNDFNVGEDCDYEYETCVATYNVVTVLESVPENAGSTVLRPNIGDSQKMLLTVDDFNLNRLPQSSILTGIDAAGLEVIQARWSHHTELFTLANDAGSTAWVGGRALRAMYLVDDYGAGMAQAGNNDLMTLFSDDQTVEAKKAALFSYINFGMDLYGSIFLSGETRGLLAGAGQSQGKILPMALFAAIAVDTQYADNVKTLNAGAQDTVETGPAELAQIWDRPNGPVWGNPIQYQGNNNYWSGLHQSQCYDDSPLSCDVNQGSDRTFYDPHGYIDGPAQAPGNVYFLIGVGIIRGVAGAALIMPEVCEVLNSPRFMEFNDRFSEHGVQADNDPCLIPDSRENLPSNRGGTCNVYSQTGCLYYGVTWGTIGASTSGDCIKADTSQDAIDAVAGGYTKAGRFTDGYDGWEPPLSYTTSQVEANWDEIYALGWCTDVDVMFNQPGTLNFDQPGTLNFNQ